MPSRAVPGTALAIAPTVNPMQEQRSSPLLLPLSVALIVAGLTILGFVLSEAYGAYSNLASNKFIADLAGYVSGEVVSLPDGGSPVVVGKATSRIAAVFLFVMLVSVGVSAGISLVKAGVQILSPQFDDKIARLRMRMEELARQNKH